MPKDIRIKIWAVNMLTRGVNAARASLLSLRSAAAGVATVGRGIMTAWRGITGAISGLFGAVQRVVQKATMVVAIGAAFLAATLKKAFEFEKYETQFAVLFKSVDKAKARLKDLADFSARTPFQLPDIVAASRSLHVFSQGVLGGVASLQLVGDAAAAVGANIGELAMWVGRAYSMIKAGRPFGEAAMRLQEMGVLSSEGRAKMEDLIKAGASAATVFGILQKELSAFSGGMKLASETGEGLVSTLKDNIGLALADFGKVFQEQAKDKIRDLIALLQQLRTDGTIEEWATRAKEALDVIGQVAKAIAFGGEGRGQALSLLADLIKAAFKDAAAFAVNILLEYAPKIGRLIGTAAQDALKFFASKRGPTATALEELEAEGKIAAGTAGRFKRETLLGDTEEAIAALPDDVKKLLSEKMDRDTAIRAGIVPDDTTPENTKEALAALKEWADAQAANVEAPGPGAGAPEDAGPDQAAENQRLQDALARADEDRVKKAKAAIEDLSKTDAWGAKAAEQARKEIFEQEEKERQAALQRLRRELLTEDDVARRQAIAEQISALENAPEEGSAATWEKVAERQKDLAPKLKKEAETTAKSIADKESELKERQRDFQLSLMSPAEREQAQRDELKRLQAEHAAETDPEKRADLALQIQDAIEKLVKFEKESKDANKPFERAISLGDIMTRKYRQDRERDPAQETAHNTAETVKLLKEIAFRGGMIQ